MHPGGGGGAYPRFFPRRVGNTPSTYISMVDARMHVLLQPHLNAPFSPPTTSSDGAVTQRCVSPLQSEATLLHHHTMHLYHGSTVDKPRERRRKCPIPPRQAPLHRSMALMVRGEVRGSMWHISSRARSRSSAARRGQRGTAAASGASWRQGRAARYLPLIEGG